MPVSYSPTSIALFLKRTLGLAKSGTGAADPTAALDAAQGYAIGSRWVNTAAQTVWTCVDATVGAAIWARSTAVTSKVGAGTVDPGVLFDTLSGWSVGSSYVNTAARTAWTCVESTAGAAIWVSASGTLSTPYPTVTLTNPTVAEGTGGTTNLVFVATLDRKGIFTADISFTGTITGGTLDATDYVGGVLPTIAGSFANGALTANISFPINPDSTVEPDETVAIRVVLTGYPQATATATGTVTNDDSAVTLAMSEPLANRIYQADAVTGGGANLGTGSIPLAITVTGGPSDIYARLRSAADGTTVLQSLGKVATSVNSGTITLAAVDARDVTVANNGWFFIDIAPSASGPWTQGTRRVAMGELISVAGQSLMYRFLARDTSTDTTITALGITPGDFGMVFASLGGGGKDVASRDPTALTWQKPATGGTYDSPGAAQFLNMEVARRKTAIGIIGHAEGGTAIAGWRAGQTLMTQLLGVQTQAGNKWRREIWYQGHGDAATGITANSYQAGLAYVFGLRSAPNTFAGTVSRYVGAYPIMNSTQFGSPREATAIRAGGRAYAAAVTNVTYLEATDVDTIDGIHENAAGAQKMGVDFARAMSPAGNVGPTLTAASRSGQTITLTFSNLGTALVGSGNWWSRIKVYSKGSIRSVWPADGGTIVSATQATIHLANDPGVGQDLDIWPGSLNEGNSTPSADVLRDDRTDTVSYGRPFFPLVTPVTCAAPTSGGAVNAPPAGNVAALSYYDMALTSATFGAEQLSGFGAVMTAGYGSTNSNIAPSVTNSGMTMELFFTPTGNPSSLQVIAGMTNGGLSLCHDSNGQLRMGLPNGGFYNTTNTVVAGHTYHASIVCGPNGSRLYVKDITAGSASSIWATQPAIKGLDWPSTSSFVTRHLGGGAYAYTAGSVFHQALYDGERWTGTTHTPPTTPLTGSEAGLIALYRLTSDGSDSVKGQ